MGAGSSHIECAEKLLRESRSISGDDLEPVQLLMATLLEAQVHATLALVEDVFPNEDAATVLPVLWWLDDDQESTEPELYLSADIARAAGAKQFREANFPDLQDAQLVWSAAEQENGSDTVELVAAGRRTGIIVRPIRPKDAA